MTGYWDGNEGTQTFVDSERSVRGEIGIGKRLELVGKNERHEQIMSSLLH